MILVNDCGYKRRIFPKIKEELRNRNIALTWSERPDHVPFRQKKRNFPFGWNANETRPDQK